MHSIRILLNGKSSDSIELRESIYALRKQGYAIEIRVTWEQQDIYRFVKEACEEGID
jgi:diacylglycerol kinase family enzyme